MKNLIVFILFLLVCPRLFAQEKSYIKKGNKLYSQKKYKEAETDYRKSLSPKSQNIEGSFNLGDALYKQKKFTDAGDEFNKLAGSAKNKQLTAAAYHNLGNSLFENKKLEQSIEAYKKALLADPKDDQTRYNLAYAQAMLKKQQQQNKQNQNNKNNKNQQNKNQNGQGNKDNKDKNKQNQDKQNQNQQNQDQNKKDQQNGQQPDKISKDDAERMLDALNQDEQKTQDKLKNKKLKGAARLNITKDW